MAVAPDAAGEASVAVLGVGVDDLAGDDFVVDVGEAAAVTVRVTVAVGVAAVRRVRAAPEPHAETSAAPPSTHMSSRRLDTS